jgi:hypothetical protein
LSGAIKQVTRRRRWNVSALKTSEFAQRAFITDFSSLPHFPPPPVEKLTFNNDDGSLYYDGVAIDFNDDTITAMCKISDTRVVIGLETGEVRSPAPPNLNDFPSFSAVIETLIGRLSSPYRSLPPFSDESFVYRCLVLLHC